MDERNTAELEKAREKAISYIHVKPRTRQQVVRYLREKKFTEDIIMEIIASLEEYRYIDDLEYAKMYFDYGFAKGRGVGRIKRELSEKGVEIDVIEMAYEELEDIPDQFQVAMEIAEGMLTGIDKDALDYDDRKRLQAKIGRRLMSRGFHSDIVYKVINRCMR